MATLVLGAVGTALGGPIGGAIGALVGRQVDSAVFGSPNMRGPRLKELEVTTSSYGAAIPRHYGRMRVPGTIIWSTELVEHEARSGGGKQSPSLTSYTYSVSFAVALSSRPIVGIGRIWADGKLLRGIEGDLKVGGELRVHTGEADQAVDPLLLAAEGAERCPAHRGIAYVVFEDLDLSEFFNRIPALTFEVLAGDRFDLSSLVTELIEDVDIASEMAPIDGLTSEGSIADALESLSPILPVVADAGGDTITIQSSYHPGEAIVLPEPAVAVDDDAFGGPAGHIRRRAASSQMKPTALRYYDVDRDYLPGIQRATLPVLQAEAGSLDVPAAMTAANAREAIGRTATRLDWSRDRVAWRMAQLLPQLVPGTIVALPDREGTWRIESWEWLRSGVELELTRRAPECGDIRPGRSADPGRSILPVDIPIPPTLLTAVELPWDGSGSSDSVVTLAGVSSVAPGWKGSALYADDGSGAMQPLGPSGRTRSVIGVAATVLPPGSPALFDRSASIDVDLAGADLYLVSATPHQLLQGANLALVGSELLQFAQASFLGGSRWRLAGFLRGRAGTEAAVSLHQSNEPFVLIDQRPHRLDASLLGERPSTEIVAVGLGDDEPVSAPILLQGIAARPLSPVHGRATWRADGSLALAWTRRARGAWAWSDGVEVPLHEEAERYLVEFRASGAAPVQWMVETNELLVSPVQIAGLRSLDPAGRFSVRQVGTRTTSPALWLCDIAA